MKFYGDVDLQENELQEIVFQTESSAPTSTVAGRLLFANKRLFIAAEIVTGSPVWIPLTNEFDTYVHTESTAASSWSVAHNLGSDTLSVIVYDSGTNSVIIPNEISYVDDNNLTITFGSAQAGRAIVIHGLADGDVDNLLPASLVLSGFEVLLMNTDSTNGDTTFVDEMGKTITSTGNVQHSTTQFKFGATSAFFDGSGDYLSFDDSTDFDLGLASEPFTIEMWVRFNAAQGVFFGRGGGAGGWNGSNGHQFIWFVSGGTLWAQWWNGTSRVDFPVSWSPTTTQWYHIAFTYDGTNSRQFVDGTLLGTAAGAYGKPTVSNITRIGAEPSGISPMINGYIDSARIEKGSARYTAAFTPPTLPFGS